MSNARNTAINPGENSDLPPSSEKKSGLLSLITNLLRKGSSNTADSQAGVIYGDDDFAGTPVRLRLLDPPELDYSAYDDEIFQNEDEDTADTIRSIHTELAELRASLIELVRSSKNGQFTSSANADGQGASTGYGSMEELRAASFRQHIRR